MIRDGITSTKSATEPLILQIVINQRILARPPTFRLEQFMRFMRLPVSLQLKRLRFAVMHQVYFHRLLVQIVGHFTSIKFMTTLFLENILILSSSYIQHQPMRRSSQRHRNQLKLQSHDRQTKMALIDIRPT